MKSISCLLLGLTALVAMNASAQANPQEPFPVKRISLSTGVTLEYVEQGDKDGVPVILLHGFPDSWRSYEHVIPHFPKTFHVFAISQRGHGNTDKPATGYFPKDFAADIAAFRALKLPPAVLVGHSMGATITMQFAISYPMLTRNIVLEGTMISFDDKPDLVEYKKFVDELKDPIDTSVIREFQSGTVAHPISENFFNTIVSESMKAKAHVWKGVWQGLMTANYRAALYSLKTPALVLWGEKDAFGPLSDQEHILDAVPGSVILKYKDTGHSLHWEQPERFAKDITFFVESLKEKK